MHSIPAQETCTDSLSFIGVVRVGDIDHLVATPVRLQAIETK